MLVFWFVWCRVYGLFVASDGVTVHTKYICIYVCVSNVGFDFRRRVREYGKHKIHSHCTHHMHTQHTQTHTYIPNMNGLSIIIDYVVVHLLDSHVVPFSFDLVAQRHKHAHISYITYNFELTSLHIESFRSNGSLRGFVCSFYSVLSALVLFFFASWCVDWFYCKFELDSCFIFTRIRLRFRIILYAELTKRCASTKKNWIWIQKPRNWICMNCYRFPMYK